MIKEEFNIGSEKFDDPVQIRQYFESLLPEYEKKRKYSKDLADLYRILGIACDSQKDYLSSLDYFHKSLSLYNKLTICGQNVDYDDLPNRIKETDQKLELHIVVIDEKYGFADTDENIIIPCKWSYALNFSEGLASVTNEKGLSGYINYHGELVIPCKYKEAWPFKNGIANVRLNEVPYYIDKKNELVGCGMFLDESQIRQMHEADVLFEFGKKEEAINKLLPVAQDCDLDIIPLQQLVHYYQSIGQYIKVVEWCERIEEEETFSDSFAWPKLLLGECYEKGQGVEKDLIKAAQWYNYALGADDCSEEDMEERDKFLARHPELRKTPGIKDEIEMYDGFDISSGKDKATY